MLLTKLEVSKKLQSTLTQVSMSLYKSKQNIEDACTKKMFDIAQQDHSSSHQMEHMILQNKLKQDYSTAFRSSLKSSVRNGVLHGSQNPSSGSTMPSRQTIGTCVVQDARNNLSTANNNITPEQNNHLNFDENINAIFNENLLSDFNSSSTNNANPNQYANDEASGHQ